MNYIEKTLTLKELFEAFGITDFSQPSLTDIKDKGILIESKDVNENKDKYCLIEDLIVKEPVNYHYELVSPSNDILKTSPSHKSYVNGFWVESFKRAEQEGKHKLIDSPINIVDLSVADTHCYYANGQLNHNTTTGGNALKFYATIRIDIRKVSSIKIGADVSGAVTKIKIVKNKVAPPFRETQIDIVFGKGIDIYKDVFDVAVNFGIIKKTGAWYAFKDDRFQGSAAVIDLLRKDSVFFEALKTLVIEQFQTKNVLNPLLPQTTSREVSVGESEETIE